jgi:FtsP/CotA-like multicopper oxidase with cupredoxin domain
MAIDRRAFLKLSGLGALAAGMPACSRQPDRAALQSTAPADYTIRIATGLVELAPDRIIATTLYNNQFPGPLIRLREGRPVTVDLYNDTDTPEQLHWHGQLVSVDVDGSAEEGTPFIPTHGHRRITFTPGPPGLRFYHTHNLAGPDLRAGQYGGQVGPVYVEPKNNRGAYDQEIFLILKEFDPSFSRGGDMPADFLAPADPDTHLEAIGESAMKASLAKGLPHGFEVGYDAFSINGRMLGHGEPIRVKANDRVLLHIVNGSATEIRSLALPGHTFQVIALDGNPVPTYAEVPVLWIGTGERVSALVKMTRPGVWILGDVGNDRDHGMGVVVEYAGASGKPQWSKPPEFKGLHALRPARCGDPGARRDDRDGFQQGQRRGQRLQPLAHQRRRLFDGQHEADVPGPAWPAVPPADAQRERRHSSNASASAYVRAHKDRGSPDRGRHQRRRDAGWVSGDRIRFHGEQSRVVAFPLPHATAHGLRIHGVI